MSTRFPRLFRFAALLAAFCLALSWAEVAVADVHDGDAEGGRSSTASVVAGEQGTPPTAPTDPVPGQHDAQSPHTCHCIHVHAAGLPVRAAEQPWAPLALSLTFPPTTALHSVAPEPHFRPPVL